MLDKSSLICPDPGCTKPNFAQDIQYTITAEYICVIRPEGIEEE